MASTLPWLKGWVLSMRTSMIGLKMVLKGPKKRIEKLKVELQKKEVTCSRNILIGEKRSKFLSKV